MLVELPLKLRALFFTLPLVLNAKLVFFPACWGISKNYVKVGTMYSFFNAIIRFNPIFLRNSLRFSRMQGAQSYDYENMG